MPSLLAELETALSLVQQALKQQDAALLEQQAVAVQRLMAEALDQARQQPIEAGLRQRLAACGAQMAAQRQALFRATAALDRAIDVLMPREATGLYGESGRAVRQRSSGDSLTA
jgi:oligoendopeptidase F